MKEERMSPKNVRKGICLLLVCLLIACAACAGKSVTAGEKT